MRAGLKRVEAADMLDVTVRTLRNWEEHKSPIPYAAFKVMRLFGGYVLAGDKWEGWSITPEKLFSPEGRSFEPHELRYIGNYFTMARLFLKSRDILNPKPIETPTPASHAASGVSPASPVIRAAARFTDHQFAGTLTPYGAAPHGGFVGGHSRLLVSKEKAKGGDCWASFKAVVFENSYAATNDDCFAEVL